MLHPLWGAICAGGEFLSAMWVKVEPADAGDGGRGVLWMWDAVEERVALLQALRAGSGSGDDGAGFDIGVEFISGGGFCEERGIRR